MLYGIYLGLELIPMRLQLGLCMYYGGSWTLWEIRDRYVITPIHSEARDLNWVALIPKGP